MGRYEMQRFHALLAEAVHEHSSLPVTTGSASLKWNAEGGSAEDNYWSDAALQGAYPSQSGHLDFYNVHYYDWMHNDNYGYDPCRENTTYWKLDKPVVVGELPPTSKFYTSDELMHCAFANGFSGDIFWAYNDPAFDYQQALPSLRSFAVQHSEISSFVAIVSWLKALL